ncbi:MAG TPA: methyltransferase domain-containing protein [Gemmatimonadales bacterium]|nr:methyltransferase domain-containing protein [Gemmatimonadales bacterium]
MTEWFEQWFGEEYLRFYRHRDDTDAEAVVALLDRTVPLAGHRVLDLACGPGRHAARLVDRGARVVGLDLSLPLLSRARSRLGGAAALVRGDMRYLPFAPATFDLIVNLFTSFGYFADDAQHVAVLREARTALAAGGRFVLDYFNADAVRATLVPREEHRRPSGTVVIDRHLSDDGRFVFKEMHMVDDGRSFVERVRLFAPAELERLVTEAGLVVERRFGDYHGAPAGPAAPRFILLCRT